MLEEIKGLNNGGNEQDIIDYVIAQGGIDNTLAVADKYCKDALAALAAVRDFPGKEFLVMAVENLADRKVYGTIRTKIGFRISHAKTFF